MSITERTRGIIKNGRMALSWLFDREGTLRNRVARGGVWVLISDVVTRLSGLIRLGILARLLGPEAFGLLGIALTIMTWVQAFSQTGVRAALIQRTGDIAEHLDQAWTIQVLRGCAFFAAMLGLAPVAASFFREPASEAIVATVGLVPLVHGFSNPAVAFLARELDFKKEFAWRMCGTIVGLASGVALALWLRNVWALVFSLLAAQLAETAASYWIQPFRPHFSWNSQKARDLLGYGRWIFLSQMFDQLNQQIDSLVVGRWLGTHQLGIYQVGRRISYTSLNVVGARFGSLLFPAFSKMSDPAQAAWPFLRSLRLLLTILLPTVSSITLYSDVLVAIAVGRNWPEAAPVAAVLAWAGLARVISSIPKACLEGLSAPNKVVLPSVIRLGIAGAGIAILGEAYGMLGIAAVISASAVAWMLMLCGIAGRLLRLRPIRLAGTALPGIAYSAPICLAAPLLYRLDGLLRSGLIVFIVGVCTAAAFLAVSREVHQLSLKGRQQAPASP